MYSGAVPRRGWKLVGADCPTELVFPKRGPWPERCKSCNRRRQNKRARQKLVESDALEAIN